MVLSLTRGRRKADDTPAPIDPRLDPRVVAARLTLVAAERLAEGRRQAVTDAEDGANRLRAQFDARQRAPYAFRPSRSTVEDFQSNIAAADELVKPHRQRLAEADRAVNQARAALAAAEGAARGEPIAADVALDWRISPRLIAATRRIDELEVRSAEAAGQREEATARHDRARQAHRDAEGAHLAGRLGEADRDRAAEAAENARRHVLRLEALATFVREDLEAARADLAEAEAAARRDAVLGLQAQYAAACAELDALLGQAADANARMVELLNLAASTFSITQSNQEGGQPYRAGLTDLTWPELGAATGRLARWRQLLSTVGLI